MLSAFHKIAVLSALSAFMAFAAVADEDPVRGKAPSGVRADGGLAQQGPAMIQVSLGFAKVLKFDSPAHTIVIGSPGIADGTLSDPHTLVLTGKSIGSTNLIALDGTGSVASNIVVHVMADVSHLTTVYHGDVQQTYSCLGSCRPLSVADAQK